MRAFGDTLLGTLVLGGLFACATWHTQHWIYTDLFVVPLLSGILTAGYALRLCILILYAIPQGIKYWWIHRIKGRAGTAGFATIRDIRRAGLFKRKGFFAGQADNKSPVFVDIESSALVLSPAGGGKTTCFVTPALCHVPDSMITPDFKGTLACMTAELRRKKHKHEIVIVNPAGLYESRLGQSARYNPLQILMDDWNDPKFHTELFSDANAIARQLCPEPTNGGDNQYWRNGARKFLVFAFLYRVTIEKNASLSNALSLLSDSEQLGDALAVASTTNLLNGDLARLAKDMLNKIEKGDPKQIESFREGAVQALEVFSPSGALAESTSVCDFRFSDLKKKITIYLVADPTRIKVYAPWLGLLSWCALTELMRTQGGNRVCMLCDEVTNFRIENFPALLTLAREFKIILWLVVQELEQWAQAYGRESLETLLSQTEVKIIMGARSHKTCQLVSDMLGEESIKTLNYNLGRHFFDDVTRTLSEGGRKLMTADEVRRTTKTILFYRNQRPILLNQVGYHEIHPWRNWVGINPLFGKKFKGRVKQTI